MRTDSPRSRSWSARFKKSSWKVSQDRGSWKPYQADCLGVIVSNKFDIGEALFIGRTVPISSVRQISKVLRSLGKMACCGENLKSLVGSKGKLTPKRYRVIDGMSSDPRDAELYKWERTIDCKYREEIMCYEENHKHRDDEEVNE